MLDLGFVRANLELVEEKLRARGADPAALLGDFRSLDQSAASAITQAETLKAQRNKLSQKVGALKKCGTGRHRPDGRNPRPERQAGELDRTAATLDEQMRLSALQSIPNLPATRSPPAPPKHDNITVKTWGEKR